jgi:sugar phosphate permease
MIDLTHLLLIIYGVSTLSCAAMYAIDHSGARKTPLSVLLITAMLSLLPVINTLLAIMGFVLLLRAVYRARP